MDIVTHALMGLAVAGPFLPTAPLTATGFIFGSVLPDLDALSRLFGRRAFLRWHQTYTHGLPAIAAAALVAWLALPRGTGEPWAPAALAAGMVLHSALDVTNTYGTAVLAPFSPRRFCTEWVFFIDAPVVVATIAALAVQWLAFDFTAPGARAVSAGYLLFLVAYWSARAALYRRARRCSPAGTLSLIPSSLLPWRYYGCTPAAPTAVRLFRLDALNGSTDRERDCPILDDAYATALSDEPEFRIMRCLSPAYHVVEAEPAAEGTRLTCRDLRTPNFGGRFGELTAVVNPAGRVVSKDFHV